MTRLACWLGCLVATCLPSEVIGQDRVSILPGILVHVAGESVIVGTSITVDGQPATAFWDKYFTELFAILDRNDDGLLDPTEAARIPKPASLLAEFRGDFDNVTSQFASPADIDRAPADGKLSREELADYLRRAGVGGGDLRVVRATGGLSPEYSRRMFDLVASPRETWDETTLVQAYDRLRQFDTNDDQRISFTELRPTNKERRPASHASYTLSLFPLTKVQAAKPPSVKLTMRLGGSTAPADGFDISGGRFEAGQMPLRVGIVRLRLNVVPGFGGLDFDASRESLLQQFEADDADRNRILDQREVPRSASSGYYSFLMAVADRNSDDRLADEELNRYLALQASAARHSVWVTASDLGSSLAAVLDADGDAELSLRELKHGWSHMIGWDRNGDHLLAWDEIPRECQLTWSIGRPKSQAATHASSKSSSPAPMWFLRMDRNGDGDLSRREFLGTLADFRRYDIDSDGLISAAEASGRKAESGKPTADK